LRWSLINKRHIFQRGSRSLMNKRHIFLDVDKVNIFEMFMGFYTF